MPAKDANYNFRVDPMLRDAFKRATDNADVSGGAVLRQAMKEFVAAQGDQVGFNFVAPKASKKGGKDV